MTDKIDTSSDALERLANDMQVHMPWGRGANTLRALSARIAELEAERDEAQEELMAAQGQIADAQAAEAQLDY